MVSGLHQPVQVFTLLTTLLAFLAATANSQTVLSSGQLATCVNDGTVCARCSSDGLSLKPACHLALCLLLQTRSASLTCSQKLIVNLVIAAGSNLVTESLDFTVPCIGRYGLTYPCTLYCVLVHLLYNTLQTMACVARHSCACVRLLNIITLALHISMVHPASECAHLFNSYLLVQLHFCICSYTYNR